MFQQMLPDAQEAEIEPFQQRGDGGQTRGQAQRVKQGDGPLHCGKGGCTREDDAIFPGVEPRQHDGGVERAGGKRTGKVVKHNAPLAIEPSHERHFASAKWTAAIEPDLDWAERSRDQLLLDGASPFGIQPAILTARPPQLPVFPVVSALSHAVAAASSFRRSAVTLGLVANRSGSLSKTSLSLELAI
jgi:hypothetical protein